MASTMNSSKSDQLIDVLKQVQARKTVRPEDATKALQQYYKVQEHIKALKSEIELFKANQEQKVCFFPLLVPHIILLEIQMLCFC
jgi:hypothetical protein